jgi:hypothetical protein
MPRAERRDHPHVHKKKIVVVAIVGVIILLLAALLVTALTRGGLASIATRWV